MKINKSETWASEKVRTMCIKHRYYTAGDCEEYSKMLSFVSNHKPTTNNIYKVAADIYEHSDIDLERYGVEKNEMITAIMFEINSECVTAHYEIA